MGNEKDISVASYNQWSQSYQIQQDDGDGVPSDGDLFVDKQSGATVPFDTVREDVVHYYRAQNALSKMTKAGFGAGIFKYEKGNALDATLPNGVRLDSGSLKWVEGQYYVEAGKDVVINGVRIYGGSRNSATYDIPVFFDGQWHENQTREVSFDIAGKKIKVKTNEIVLPTIIKFEPGNPFVPSETNDNLEIEIEGGSFVLENREAEGLIPRLSVRGDADIKILNGDETFFVQGVGQITSYPRFFEESEMKREYLASSVPMEIRFSNENGEISAFHFSTGFGGNPVFTTGLVLNNYGQTGIFTFDGVIDSGATAASISTSMEDNRRVYSLDDLKQLFPDLKIKGSYNSQRIKQTIDLLQTLPPKVLSNLEGIDFVPTDLKAKRDAYATSDRWIHLYTTRINVSTFQHECAHIRTFYLESLNAETFQKRWLSIAGDIYGKYIDEPNHFGSTVWRGEESPSAMHEPRHGCVRPYGSLNYREDIATFVEMIWTQPEKIKKLLDRENPNYDPRYQKKVDSLLEYGFITKERYENLLPKK